MEFGRALQKGRETKAKAQTLFPCPEPEFLRDENIRKVAEYTRDTFASAEQLLLEKPAKFYRLLGSANAKAEAEPIQFQVAQAKAKAKAAHQKAAEDSIKKGTRRRSATTKEPEKVTEPPPYDDFLDNWDSTDT